MFHAWSWLSWFDPTWVTNPDFYIVNLLIALGGVLVIGLFRELLDKDREVVGVPLLVALPMNSVPILVPMLLYTFAGSLSVVMTGAELLYYDALLVLPSAFFVVTFFNVVFVRSGQPIFVVSLLTLPGLFALWFDMMFRW